MISEVVMPQMGADMTEGTLVQWRKREGEPVDRGEIIAEIETDKANVEIEAFESGVFRKALVGEGETVSVGTPIGIIAAAEDDISAYVSGTPAAAAAEESSPAEAPALAEAAMAQAQAPAAAPEAGTTTQPPPPQKGRVRASPVAKQRAKEIGVDIASLRGTGPDGRILLRDVQAARPDAQGATAGQTSQPSKMRQAIARRMSQSKREAPHYYVTVDVDMSMAEQLRHQLNDLHHRELHVSVNDVVVKACALALERHPEFNAWFVEEGIQAHDRINISIGIALDDGLIAPAVLDCQSKTLIEISTAARDLVERSKSGSLRPDEYTGGTFTVSNLGAFGIETLIPIIQPPQAAILGVGSIRDVPVVREGQVVAGRLMKLALAADHRVTDGAQGARLLSEIRGLLEKPVELLV